MSRPFTYTNKELQEKIDEYFNDIDSTPLFRYEQRRGNIVIPKNFEGSITDFEEASLIKVPVPKIYLEGQLCVEYLGFDRDYLTDTMNSSIEKLKKNKFESDEERENIKDLLRIVVRAKEKCSGQKIQLASAGLANPLIVSRLEGLKEKTDVTTNDKDINASVTISFKAETDEDMGNIDDLQRKLSKE
jgi:hypothetical protein